MNKILRPARVYLEGVNPDEPIDALVHPDVTWNGWACPFFRLADAQRFAHLWRDSSSMHWEGSAEYDEATDTFTFRDSESEEPEIVKGVDLDGEHVYPIGSHAWTWSEADAVPETQEERAHVTLDRVVKRLREVETFLASLHDEGKGGETAFGEMRAEVAKAIEEIESVECYS